MNLTSKDITSCTILKSSREGEVLELQTLGGLYLIMLKRPNGDIEQLSSSTSSLRSQALANKKYPHLEVPVIVKSAKDIVEEEIMLKSAEPSPGKKAWAATTKAKANTFNEHKAAQIAHMDAEVHHRKLASRAQEKAYAGGGESARRLFDKHKTAAIQHAGQSETHRKLANQAHESSEEQTEPSGPPTGMKTKSAEGKLVFGSSEKKPSPKAQAHNNLSDAKHSLLTAKQKIGKLISKPKTMKLGEDEATRKVDTLSTQRAVRRNQSKLQKQKPSFTKRPTPPSSAEMSQEVTRKLPMPSKPKMGY